MCCPEIDAVKSSPLRRLQDIVTATVRILPALSTGSGIASMSPQVCEEVTKYRPDAEIPAQRRADVNRINNFSRRQACTSFAYDAHRH
jgi:hypothetical protein